LPNLTENPGWNLSRPAPQLRAIDSILKERDRQDEKWGEQNPPNGTGSVMLRTRAHQARTACDDAFARGIGTWQYILEEEFAEAMAEEDVDKLREELVHVAAVAVAWIEALERQNVEA
jgi:hypothetical protein